MPQQPPAVDRARDALALVIDVINKSAQKSKAPWVTTMFSDIPKPPPPGIFQSDPQVTGFNPEEHRQLIGLLDHVLHPGVKSSVRSLSQSPVPPSNVREWLNPQVGPEHAIDPRGTNLAGVFYKPWQEDQGDVWLNREMLDADGPDERFKTLVHELGHAGGLPETLTTAASQVMKKKGITREGEATAMDMLLKYLTGR